jgi:hypothetical protein
VLARVACKWEARAIPSDPVSASRSGGARGATSTSSADAAAADYAGDAKVVAKVAKVPVLTGDGDARLAQPRYRRDRAPL